MAIKLSRTVCSIAESATLAIDAAAKAMKKAGKDVVNLSAGEPDFDTPLDIRKAATAAMESGFTRYCPAGGIPDLREAIVEKLRKDNNLEYAPDCVAVTNGAKQAIYLALQSILDPGDRVLVQAPYWVSYSEMVKSLGGVPVCLPAKYADGFAFDVNQVVKRITPRTKAIILNSPNNPTGAVLPQETLAQLAEALFKRKAGGGKTGKKKPIAGMCVISDEIYEKLVYAPMTSCACSCSCGTPAPVRHVSIASLSDEAKEHTIVINGVSKSHAMTGWRIGYAAGPKAVIQAITKLLGQTTSGSCSISQKAAVAALRMPPDTVESMRKVFDERRRFMIARLRSMTGVTCPEPLGAFYAFPDIRGFMGKKLGGVRIGSCMEFAKALLEKKEVAIVPGMAFGAPGFARLSYAASMETLKKGLDRIEELLGEMR